MTTTRYRCEYTREFNYNKHVQLDIHAAEEVIAVAFARVALLNISTGIAQDSGPRHEEKTRLNNHVIDTNALLALWLFVAAGKIAMRIVPITNVSPDRALPQTNGPRRPRRSINHIHKASPISAMTELPDWSPSVVEVWIPMLWKMIGA